MVILYKALSRLELLSRLYETGSNRERTQRVLDEAYKVLAQLRETRDAAEVNNVTREEDHGTSR